MDKDIVYEDYLLVCEAGSAICQLKCHNKMSVDVGGACSIPFGIGTTADNKEENIGSLDEKYFGMCLYKGKCDLQVLGGWTKQHDTLYIGSAKALLIDSKLPCNISSSSTVTDAKLSKLKQLASSDSNVSLTVNSVNAGDPGDVTASGGQLTPGTADITITGTKYISIFKNFDSAMGMMANSRVLKEKAEGDLITAATTGVAVGAMMLLFPQVGVAIGAYAGRDMAFSSIMIGGTMDNLKARYDKYKDLERRADLPEMKEFWSRQFWLESGAEYGPMMLVGVYQSGPGFKNKFTELKAYYSKGLSEEEMILYGLRNRGATVAAGQAVEGGVMGDDGRFYTDKLSDEFKRLEYKTYISEKGENKILFGEPKPRKLNEIIGGHSPEINNANPNYKIKEVIVNPDGTKAIKFEKVLPNGELYKAKKSTVFPETWSNEDVINSIKQVGDTQAVGVRLRDQTTIHLGEINGVQVEVMKIGGYTTSGYPTGGKPMDLGRNGFTPIIFE